MKKILFFGLFLCLGMTLKAQYGGEMTIGARLNYTGGGKLVTYDGKIVNLGYTIKGIVSPGYFVTNNIALGADLAYEYMMATPSLNIFTFPLRRHIKCVGVSPSQ